MKVIALDVGEKRIGVAKADSNTRIAVPVGFLVVDGSEWQEIARIAKLSSTNLFVLGLPRSNDGNETRQTLYVRNFARTLCEKIPGAKIRFQDESLTSVEAEKRLKESGKKYKKGDIDAEAATIILQDFLEGFRASESLTSNNRAGKTHTSAATVKHSEKNTVETKPRTLRDMKAIPEEKLKTTYDKAKLKGKKMKKLLIISPITIVVILLGITAVLKIRDFVRAEREREYAEQEAAMKAKVFSFTITPGETIFDVKKKLLTVTRDNSDDEEKVPNYTAEEIEAAFNADYDFEFLRNRPAGASLEGYLYPETHEFYASDTVEAVIQKFLEGMNKVIVENDLVSKYAEHNLSLHDGITLASVVQKESVPGEQATVAQVFYSRLAYGWKLGSDVTVSYALDLVDPERTIYRDNAAALTIDSCYNTRLYAGLPCGPISNPGLSALQAVANPADSAYLYFLTGDDGMMYYSYTEAEHNQNAYLHCQTLCNVSL